MGFMNYCVPFRDRPESNIQMSACSAEKPLTRRGRRSVRIRTLNGGEGGGMRLWAKRSRCSRWLAVGLEFSAAWATGQDLATRAAAAWRLESSGDGEQALASLRQAATNAPNDPVALRAYAEFLERHHDAGARETYGRLDQLLQRTSAPAEQRAAVAQRLAVLDLLAGDREAAARHLEEYTAAGGKDLTLPPHRTAAPPNYIEIPG